ncbi:MAG: protease modulator HflC [bacterium]
MERSYWRTIGTGAVILAVVAGIVALTTFTVPQNEYGVVTRFGKTVRVVEEPGLYTQLPYPIHRVHRFDRRLQLHESPLMETLTEDPKNIAVRYSVVWRISDVETFYTSLGSIEAMGPKLEHVLSARGKNAIGNFKKNQLLSVDSLIKIPELEAQVREELSEVVKDSEWGITINSVEISRLALPEFNTSAVYERMRSERKIKADEYQSKGEEAATKIRAEADRKKQEILSEAYEKAEAIRGEGDAEAARIYAAAFSKDPEFYRFWRTLQSYDKILGQKSTLVLSDDSELFQYLER